jgi:4-diphosphocytidyl-2-C-methyl-D-erythritol kinase
VRLRALAPAKVNLGLYVGTARDDGYHPLASVVQPLSLADELVLEPAPDGATADEVVCPGVEGDNLAARALAAYREATGWSAPPQRLTITKRIPVAAGMGGGSSDAATALRLAAHAAKRPDDPVIHDIAPTLGADVPVLIDPHRALMTGVGETVRVLPPPRAYALVIVPSEHALSTPAVYGEFDRLGLGRSPEELEQLSHVLARIELSFDNDLATPARSLCPSIEPQLERLREAGAIEAMVSGSGPTVFGVFHDEASAAAAAERIPRAVTATPVGPGFAAPRPA